MTEKIRVRHDTGVDQNDAQIKVDFPGLGFGQDTDLSDIDRPFLVLVDPPLHDPGERVVRGPNTLIEGVWTQTWVVETIPFVVPQEVSTAQAHAVLIDQDMWDGVVQFIDAIADPKQKAIAEVAVYRTRTWKRSSPMLNAVADALGMTEADKDALFIAAEQVDF